MSEISPEEKLEIKKKSHKQLMWVGVFSIAMMFAGLSSAYIVSKADGTWVKILVPNAFFISTVLILISSVTFYLAVKNIKAGRTKMTTALIGLTLILGLGFVKFQFDGWSYLNERGNYLGGKNKIAYLVNNENSTYGEDYVIVQKGNELTYFEGEFYDKRDVNHTIPVKKVDLESSNNSSSFFFLLTLLHVVHLVGGLISLIVVLIKSANNKYSINDHIGIKVSAIYWHFLDFLWLYLLGLLYFVG